METKPKLEPIWAFCKFVIKTHKSSISSVYDGFYKHHKNFVMINGFLVVSSSGRARSTATRCAHVDALAAALCVQRVVCRPPSGYFQARRRGPRAAATARRVLGAMKISMVSATTFERVRTPDRITCQHLVFRGFHVLDSKRNSFLETILLPS